MPQSIISQFQRQYNSPIEVNRQVATATERDAINSSVRWRGMLVHVIADDTTYELVGGIDNGSWQELGGLQDAPSDGNTYGRKDGAWSIISTSVNWGEIGGTLANQTDLQNALNGKANLSTSNVFTNNNTFNFSVAFNAATTQSSAYFARVSESQISNLGSFGYNNSNLFFFSPANGFGEICFFDFSQINTSNKTFTFPNQSGTLALETTASGSFTTTDGKTVTVVNGIITNIV